MEYPAPGSPEFARRVKDLVSTAPVELDEYMGIDHGTWSVLTRFPNADIPVVQLSIDNRYPPMLHYQLGTAHVTAGGRRSDHWQRQSRA